MQSNDPDNDYAFDATNPSPVTPYTYTLTCETCGWHCRVDEAHEAANARVVHRLIHRGCGSDPVIVQTRSPR